MHHITIQDYGQWRESARRLRMQNVPPHDVQFMKVGQATLFAESPALPPALPDDLPGPSSALRVPKEFLELATEVGYHRDPLRWELLYRVLWRLTSGEPQLMQLATDDDMHRLLMMEKAVRRDAHKMKAFVRFREVVQDDGPHFIAWHRPDHFIVRKVAPFFSRRFKAMNWTILTPDESVTWDQRELTYFDGVDRSAAPTSDQLEDLWRTYYANIFNPARIKLKAMKAEMPVRHWGTLPETQAIEQMLKDAPARVQTMIDRSEGFAQTARDYFPSDTEPTLNVLAEAAKQCQACDLHCHATQVVFGYGPQSARIVLVGEQPGDQEDLAGQPFVGPAGEVLNRALAAVGLSREELYITNVVKHFKFERSGKRRLHKRPDSREIRACRPWFEAEWSRLQQASILVCLGATPATALINPGFRIQQQRGQWITSKFCNRTLATWHPSSILRLPDEEQKAARFAELVADLREVAVEAKSTG